MFERLILLLHYETSADRHSRSPGVLAFACCTTEADRNRMRAELDSINQRNRNDQPFTVQDVKPYVQFFDDHGTPNDRLLAHYLLGRAYYEAGEAPMALECYQKALDCADTTAKGFDYSQLSRVYAQMAEVFYHQGLYREQLEHERQSVKYAWKGKDTLSALMNYEQESFAYSKLGLIDSAIVIIEDVSQKYAQYDYHKQSIISYGAIIRPLIDNKMFGKAEKLMNRYESASGLFDSSGNIEKGREVYYKAKGLYYLYNNMYDSAEYFFRKELRDGKDFNNQNAAAMGLALLCQKTHKTDSAAKYAIYAYAMNDSVYAHQATETVERMQSMYNYSQHQKKARQEEKKASDRLIYIWITIAVIMILLVILVVILFILQHVRQKRKKIEAKYQQSVELIAQAKKDLAQLQEYKDNNKQLIAEKEELIHEQDAIRKQMIKKERSIQESVSIQFKSTNVYQRFIKLSDNGKQPTKAEWVDLQDAIFSAYPNFSELMTVHYDDLDDKEYKVCLLIRADFKPNSISNMLDVLPSTITQIRKRLNKKLFGRQENSKDFDILLKKIY